MSNNYNEDNRLCKINSIIKLKVRDEMQNDFNDVNEVSFRVTKIKLIHSDVFFL